MKTILVLAPHPDDEILGCGGTIAKFAQQGCNVYIANMTTGFEPRFSKEELNLVRQGAKKAHDFLGVKETYYLDFPAAELDTVQHADLNAKVAEVIKQIKPDMLFLPFIGDIHLDHQLVFNSALVAARPVSDNYPKTIYAYEVLSETNWNAPYLTPSFQPNVFIDISDFLEKKLKAFSYFENQRKEFPSERSLESIEYLAKLRGSQVHCKAAEAFVLIREVLS